MASRSGVLYVGMTNNLARRVREHRRKEADSFTARYNVTRLVRYRAFPRPQDAIAAETKIKRREDDICRCRRKKRHAGSAGQHEAGAGR